MPIEEKTLVIIKNEAIRRKLIGRIIQSFEDAGMKIINIKMVKATSEQAYKHYNNGEDKKWLKGVGQKALKLYQNDVNKLKKLFGTSDNIEIGKTIYLWSVKQLIGKNLVVLVLQGPSAIEKTKIIVGSNIPSESDLSTIRGKFASDSLEKSHYQKRAIHNVVHRSTSAEEFRREYSVWFDKSFKLY